MLIRSHRVCPRCSFWLKGWCSPWPRQLFPQFVLYACSQGLPLELSLAMAMFKAGGCYVRCQPLPTGADAVCLTEFLGAAFACVQWLEEKETQDYIYKIGLFYFESAAKKDEAHIALSTAFPGVVPEEGWFASIGREEWLVMLEEEPPRYEWARSMAREWDDSSDMTVVNLNCRKGDAIARARITIGCVVDCPRCIAPESHKTSHSLDCMGWMNNSSQVPECRPISSIGLPRHSITDEGGRRR